MSGPEGVGPITPIEVVLLMFLRVTGWLTPPAPTSTWPKSSGLGVTCSEDAVTCPVTLTDMADPPLIFDLIVIIPFAVPAATGWAVTVTVQLAPAVRVAGIWHAGLTLYVLILDCRFCSEIPVRVMTPFPLFMIRTLLGTPGLGSSPKLPMSMGFGVTTRSEPTAGGTKAEPVKDFVSVICPAPP